MRAAAPGVHSPAAPPPPLPGAPALSSPLPPAFGPYRPLRRLGSGGMGSVYEAEDAHTGARCALKVIPADALDPDALARLRREAEAMARAAHANVARIHAASFDPPQCYLVIDLYPGGDLAQQLKARSFDPEEAREVVAQLADGLAHAHAQGVIHRDVKPENVLLDDHGRPVLADFGLSRQAGAERLTLTGEVLGSPLYMAPEQVTDAKEAGPPADVYGLGAVLYHLLTGRPPFLGQSTVLATLAQVHTATPPAPRSLRPEVPVELERVCLWALQRSPRARPSAAELAAALRTPGASRRARLAPAGAVAAIGLLAVLCAALAWGLRRAEDAPAPLPLPSAPAEPAIPSMPPPSWVQDLDGRCVLLSLVSEDRALAVLATSELAPLAEGGTVWTLTPRRARADRGRGPPPRLGELAEVDSSLAAELFQAPFVVTFDRWGSLGERAESPLDTLSEPEADTLANLAWNELRAEPLRALFAELLSLPQQRGSSLVRGFRVMAHREGLLGLVAGRPWGDVALQTVRAGRAGVTSPRGATTVNLHDPEAQTANCLDGELAAANATTLEELGEFELLEVPEELSPPQMPFQTLVSRERPRVYSRPWGSPLGRLSLPGPSGVGYLVHGTSGGWTAVGWKAGVAWVRSERAERGAPGENPFWIAVICSGPRALPVLRGRGSARRQLGLLRHGQRVAVRHTGDTMFSPVIPGTSVPILGAWIEVSWGEGVAQVRASEYGDEQGAYDLFLCLLRPFRPAPPEFSLDALPELPRSNGR
ncbi:MAG: serine/threonine-protein kinase [Planctomycetota bacterium]